MAERDAAIHAPRALLAHVGLALRQIHFLPVVHAQLDRTRRGFPRRISMNPVPYPRDTPTSSANAGSRFSDRALAWATRIRL